MDFENDLYFKTSIEDVESNGLFYGSGVVGDWEFKRLKNKKLIAYNYFCLNTQVKFPKPPKKRDPLEFSVLFYPVEHEEFLMGCEVRFCNCGGSIYKHYIRFYDLAEYIKENIWMWLEGYAYV